MDIIKFNDHFSWLATTCRGVPKLSLRATKKTVFTTRLSTQILGKKLLRNRGLDSQTINVYHVAKEHPPSSEADEIFLKVKIELNDRKLQFGPIISIFLLNCIALIIDLACLA